MGGTVSTGFPQPLVSMTGSRQPSHVHPVAPYPHYISPASLPLLHSEALWGWGDGSVGEALTVQFEGWSSNSQHP